MAGEITKRDQIYGWAIFIALCLFVLLRLLVWKFFIGLEPFVKEDLSNLLCVIPMLILAIFVFGRKAVCGQPLQERRTGLESALWVYFAACALSLVPAIDRSATLRYVVVLFSYLIFFFMLTENLNDERRRTWLLVFFMGLALLIAGWGIRDYIYLVQRAPEAGDSALMNTNDSLYYILMNKRACSFFGWPNVLAGFLGLSIPLGLAAAFMWRAVWAKVVAGIGVVVMLTALLMTFSFLGWSSFLAGFASATAVLFFRHKGIGRGAKITFILLAVTAAALFAVVVVKKNFAIAVGPRQQYFNQAVQGIKQHPLLGTGLDTFRYASTREAVDKGGLTAFAHNSYLQVWVEAGLFGFLAVIFLAFQVLKKFYGLAWRPREGTSDLLRNTAFVWAFTSVFVDNLWSFTIVKPNISLFFWVVLAYACSFDTKVVSRKEYKWPVRTVAGWIAVVVVVVVLGFTARATFVQWMCQKAFVAERTGQMNNVMEAFKWARKIDPYDAKIAFELGKRYSQFYQQTGDQRLLVMAEQEFLASSENSPFYGSRLMLGLIYRAQGRMAEARDWIAEASSVSQFETQRDLQAIMAVQPVQHR